MLKLPLSQSQCQFQNYHHQINKIKPMQHRSILQILFTFIILKQELELPPLPYQILVTVCLCINLIMSRFHVLSCQRFKNFQLSILMDEDLQILVSYPCKLHSPQQYYLMPKQPIQQFLDVLNLIVLQLAIFLIYPKKIMFQININNVL